jgi:hypothetical protein
MANEQTELILEALANFPEGASIDEIRLALGLKTSIGHRNKSGQCMI